MAPHRPWSGQVQFSKKQTLWGVLSSRFRPVSLARKKNKHSNEWYWYAWMVNWVWVLEIYCNSESTAAGPRREFTAVLWKKKSCLQPKFKVVNYPISRVPRRLKASRVNWVNLDIDFSPHSPNFSELWIHVRNRQTEGRQKQHSNKQKSKKRSNQLTWGEIDPQIPDPSDERRTAV